MGTLSRFVAFLLLLGSLVAVPSLRATDDRDGQAADAGARSRALGDGRSAAQRVRARLLTYLLGLGSAREGARSIGEERLELQRPVDDSALTEALLGAEAPLPTRVTELLARPWPPALAQGAPTLAAFMRELREGDDAPTGWRCRTMEASLAKPLARRICRTREQDVSLAATLLPGGGVREWEVVSTRAGSKAIEFLAFDADGRRTLLADFGDAQEARLLPAPQSCAACHYDPRTDSFRQQPHFAPAQPWLRWEDLASDADARASDAL